MRDFVVLIGFWFFCWVVRGRVFRWLGILVMMGLMDWIIGMVWRGCFFDLCCGILWFCLEFMVHRREKICFVDGLFGGWWFEVGLLCTSLIKIVCFHCLLLVEEWVFLIGRYFGLFFHG